MITFKDVGKSFKLKGVEHYTYELVWASQSQDWCGVIPSWSADRVEYTVRTSNLIPLEGK
jgi:hypothetical protein